MYNIMHFNVSPMGFVIGPNIPKISKITHSKNAKWDRDSFPLGGCENIAQ